MAARKIVFVTPMHFDEGSYIGGGERYPLNLAHGVVAGSGGRFDVEIISYGSSPARLELSKGLVIRVMEQANRPANAADALSWELPDALAEADLVHVHQAFTRSSEVALLVAKQQRSPVCMTDHGGTSSTLAASLGSLELAEQIICYSQFAASLLRTHTPIEIVKGGVDGTFFTPADPPVNRDRVLYVGRLLAHKGIDNLISALPTELPLTVCGRVHDHQYEYFELLQALARGKQVEFITDAADEDLLNLYRRSWATVLPSVYRDCYGNTALAPELMGISLLESMACGTPAICSRVAAMPEFVDDGDTGFVYDSLAQLAQRLRLLANDRSLTETMGASGRQKVEQEYDRAVVGTKVASIYEGILDRHPAMAG